MSSLRSLGLSLALLPLLTQPLNAQADTSRIEKSGSAVAVGLPLVAAGITLLHGDSEALWQLAKSEAATLAVTEVLKHTVHAQRPDGTGNDSFPSRHAGVAFAAAQYMQMEGGIAYGLPAYLAAAYVGYSRVHADKHYWRDVAAGALIGITSSYYFTDTRYGTRVSFSAGPKSAFAQIQANW